VIREWICELVAFAGLIRLLKYPGEKEPVTGR